MRKVFAILPMLIAAGASAGAAQSFATGLSGVGTQDASWTVSWVSGPYSATPASSPAYSAYVVPAVGGVWQPDGGVNATNWISAWTGASAADGVGDYNELNDAGNRYTYTFSYNFTATGAGALNFSAGWDNIFEAFILNGVVYSPSALLTSVTDQGVDNHFGFCRSDDGALASADFPNCTADFSAPGVQQGENTLQFIIRGDGATDGLWVDGMVEGPSLPQEALPEPGTMAMVATGLVGMSAAGFRRKRKIQG